MIIWGFTLLFHHGNGLLNTPYHLTSSVTTRDRERRSQRASRCQVSFSYAIHKDRNYAHHPLKNISGFLQYRKRPDIILDSCQWNLLKLLHRPVWKGGRGNGCQSIRLPGRGRQLYWLAIISPYAPALRKTTISPRCVYGMV